MAKTRHPSLPQQFLDRLMERIDPHKPPVDAALFAAQLNSGRLLGIQRLKLEKRIEDVAAEARVSPTAILLIETGLGHAKLLSKKDLERLSTALADQQQSPAWIEGLLMVALTGRGAAVDPKMVEILELLKKCDLHFDGLCEAMQRKHRLLGDARISELLEVMLSYHWVAEAGARLDPELGEELLYYQITSSGRSVLEAESSVTEPNSQQPDGNLGPGLMQPIK